jgi:hypothetical protein
MQAAAAEFDDQVSIDVAYGRADPPRRATKGRYCHHLRIQPDLDPLSMATRIPHERAAGCDYGPAAMWRYSRTFSPVCWAPVALTLQMWR